MKKRKQVLSKAAIIVRPHVLTTVKQKKLGYYIFERCTPWWSTLTVPPCDDITNVHLTSRPLRLILRFLAVGWDTGLFLSRGRNFWPMYENIELRGKLGFLKIFRNNSDRETLKYSTSLKSYPQKGEGIRTTRSCDLSHAVLRSFCGTSPVVEIYSHVYGFGILSN